MPRERFLALLLVAGSLALLFTAGELGLRIHRHSTKAGQPHVIEPDRSLGWRAKPDYTYSGLQRDLAGNEYAVHIETNAQGFRYYGDPASPRKKILFVGDSVTYAREVTQDKSFPALLGQALDAEIFACAAPGYGTLQEYLLLDRWLDTIAPDLIIWQFTNNDLINNQWGLDHRSMYQAFAVPKPYLEEGQIVYRNPAPGPCQRALGPIPSRLLQAILRRADRLFFDLPTPETTIEMEIRATGPSHPGLVKAAEATRAIMQRVQRRCGEIPLIAFNVLDREPFTQAIQSICTELGIPMAQNVPDVLKAAGTQGVVYLAEDNAHWTEPGHQIAADALLDFLRKENLP